MAPIRVSLTIEDTVANTFASDALVKDKPGVRTPGDPARRPRISLSSVDSLESLSIGDRPAGLPSKQSQRPRALPSPDANGERVVGAPRVKVSPGVHIQRPRAVLSSPENDQMILDLQEQSTSVVNATNEPPKAPLSPVEEAYGTLVKSSNQLDKVLPFSPRSDEGSLKNMSVPRAPVATKQFTDNNQVKRTCTSEFQDQNRRRAAGNGIGLENRIASEKLHMECDAQGRKKLTLTKQSGLKSGASRNDLKKDTRTPDMKGNSGRIIRPWH